MTYLRTLVFKNAPAANLTRKEFDFASQKVAFKAPSTAGDPGSFEGYGAVYGNVDRDNEIIAPGAFAESLPAFIRDGFIADAHNWEKGIATITDAIEDGYGLLIKCLFQVTRTARKRAFGQWSVLSAASR